MNYHGIYAVFVSLLSVPIPICDERGRLTCTYTRIQITHPKQQNKTPQSAAGGELAGLFLLEHQGG